MAGCSLGIDPGGRAPGYCVEFEGAVFRYATWAAVLADGWGSAVTFKRIVTEGTWHRPRAKRGEKKSAPPAAIAKLSFTCGLQLMRAMCFSPAAKAYRLPVEIWKPLAVYGGARLLKDVFVSRLAKQEGLGPEWTEDQIEARGLLLAAAKLPAKTLEKYRIKDPK